MSTDRVLGVTANLGRKAPVRVATRGAIALAGLQTIDGILVAEGDRVLVKDQADASQHGIYNASSGTWRRAVDFDSADDFTNGTDVSAGLGSQAGRVYVVSFPEPFTLNTTALTFTWHEVAPERGRKAPVRVATTANIALAGLQIIDGVQLVDADRVLVKNQTAPAENGIYVASAGAWGRPDDFNNPADIANGTEVVPAFGTQAGQTLAVTFAEPVVIGTTALTWTRRVTGGSVNSSGGITPGNVAIFVDANTIADSGSPIVSLALVQALTIAS